MGSKPKFLMLLLIAISCISTNYVFAQEDRPLTSGRFAIAGYGDVTYTDTDLGNDTFSTKLAPIFLFQLNDQIHVEAELEYTLNNDGTTDTAVEYADMHYFLTDYTTLTAGKFLLPFGQFGQNLHPSWINRLPSSPGIYGGHHSTGLMEGLIPILSDVGISVQYIHKFSNNLKFYVDLYLVNGVGEEAGHGEDEALDDHGDEIADHADEADDHGDEVADHDDEADDHDDEADDHVDEIADHDDEVEAGHIDFASEPDFIATSSDNNNDKAFGGKIGLTFLPQWEVGYSYYQAAFDDAEELDFKATAVDINWTGTYLAIRGEYIKTETENFVEIADEDDPDHTIKFKDTFDRNGWYLQASWQLRQLRKQFLNPVELVVRYAETNKSGEGEQWTYGINYWISASAVFKLAYEDTEMKDGRTDSRVFAQLSYGF